MEPAHSGLAFWPLGSLLGAQTREPVGSGPASVFLLISVPIIHHRAQGMAPCTHDRASSG